jgi:ketosteroid isomerase-like protein
LAEDKSPTDLFETQIAAYAALDTERLMATFTEDCVLQDMADPENPFVGTVAIRGFLDEYFSTLADVSVEITTVVANGDKVVGELEVKATYVGEPYSRADGREVIMRYCVIDTVRDSAICFERFYWDRAEFERQLA